MSEATLKDLLEQYIIGTIKEEDKLKLAHLIDQSEYREELENLLEDSFATEKYLNEENGKLRIEIQQWLKERIAEDNQNSDGGVQNEGGPKVIPFGVRRRRFWVQISVAASVLLLVSFGIFYALKKEDNNLAKTPSTKTKPNDIPPGGDKAILTLADGRKIILDTASNGALTVEGGIKVIKAGGQLRYNEQTKSTEVHYNTVSTPRGGQYQLELADGSRVWLNAASSLRFPTAFFGDDRTVELTGEGYFEVAHDTSRPFHVKVGDMDVKVLGTHFNINSYTDEPTIKTTLLQGRVSVRKGEQFVFLNPGQQAMLTGSQIQIDNNVDVDEVVAWKNGWFNFNSLRIQDILRQLSRWYNVDIIYEGVPTQHRFTGMVSRNSKVSEVLKIMEQAGMVFRIEGRTITVLK